MSMLRGCRVIYAGSSRLGAASPHRRYIHLLRDLPTPSLERLSKRPKLVACDAVESECTDHYSPSQHLSKWTASPDTLLLIQKPDDQRTTAAMGTLLKHLQTHHPSLRLIIEPHTARDHPDLTQDCILCQPNDEKLLALHSNLVITLGGDGTILHVSNLFGQGECPPVLSFSMGSLGFLLPFHIDSLGKTLETTLEGPVSLLNRMRLACMPLTKEGNGLACTKTVGDAGWQVMNEVTLHRGRNPHLTVVDAFFDNQHLTEAVADGLLLSTPTGSTAYSLSAGGPISHPETDAFLLTPIAPRSLSFRTVVLPGRGTVELKISDLARAPAELSVDGREVCLLNSGESVVIKKSPFPIPCVVRGEGGGGWAKDINSLLQFNTGFKNSAHLAHTMS